MNAMWSIPERGGKHVVWMLLILVALLGWLFHDDYAPGHVAFSNDGPLGRTMSQCHHLPEGFTGVWQDLNSIGYHEGSALPNITFAVRWLLGPLWFAKIYPVLALLILGLGAWCFFRELNLTPLACFLGTLAATLNSTFFSAVCWGVGSHAITIGMTFFALACLVNSSADGRWVRLVWAGLAVGMGVSEGADIGAMFSLYVVAFLLYQSWTTEQKLARKAGFAASQLLVIGLAAVLVAAQPVHVLLETQIKGIAPQQNSPLVENSWDWATKWSLPKREALGLLIPGLFGYRVDTAHGGQYWGAAGRDAVWVHYFENDSVGELPRGVLRFTGGGNYTGILVILVACWAVFQALLGAQSVFSPERRRWIWFWAGQAILSLLLAFGKFAPFYRLLYALPLAATVRNPAKFIHPVSYALVVLFAYGIHGLQSYLQTAENRSQKVVNTLGGWLEQLRGFDRWWAIGCFTALAASLGGWGVYAANSELLERYLRRVQFEPAVAQTIARFSIGQVGWFVVWFAVAVLLLLAITSGVFNGRRARWVGPLLAFFVVLDLCRANKPWIIDWDIKEKYASNPIIDALREHPNQQRVAILPFLSGPQDAQLDRVYHAEWVQHQFPLRNIQSLDIIQMSRVPTDLAAFEGALQFQWNSDTIYRLVRRWQLTNTRYLLGAASLLDVLNQEIDPARRRFKTMARFSVVAKIPNADPTESDKFTAVLAPDGQYALFEFSGALPRTRLYTSWLVETNAARALEQVAAPMFDPDKNVLVTGLAPAATADSSGPEPAPVQFESYTPKDIVLHANTAKDAILLLNDRFDPNWEVLVDGRKETLLRCNYLMRGVYLRPGDHRIEFVFRPPIGPLYVSVAAIAMAPLLLFFVSATRKRIPAPARDPTPEARSAARKAEYRAT